jgi:hypothetical protein
MMDGSCSPRTFLGDSRRWRRSRLFFFGSILGPGAAEGTQTHVGQKTLGPRYSAENQNFLQKPEGCLISRAAALLI